MSLKTHTFWLLDITVLPNLLFDPKFEQQMSKMPDDVFQTTIIIDLFIETLSLTYIHTLLVSINVGRNVQQVYS